VLHFPIPDGAFPPNSSLQFSRLLRSLPRSFLHVTDPGSFRFSYCNWPRFEFFSRWQAVQVSLNLHFPIPDGAFPQTHPCSFHVFSLPRSFLHVTDLAPSVLATVTDHDLNFLAVGKRCKWVWTITLSIQLHNLRIKHQLLKDC
jgi:hypothetical protein